LIVFNDEMLSNQRSIADFLNVKATEKRIENVYFNKGVDLERIAENKNTRVIEIDDVNSDEEYGYLINLILYKHTKIERLELAE
jgi:hypothetical protein